MTQIGEARSLAPNRQIRVSFKYIANLVTASVQIIQSRDDWPLNPCLYTVTKERRIVPN